MAEKRIPDVPANTAQHNQAGDPPRDDDPHPEPVELPFETKEGTMAAKKKVRIMISFHASGRGYCIYVTRRTQTMRQATRSERDTRN